MTDVVEHADAALYKPMTEQPAPLAIAEVVIAVAEAAAARR
jgi:hypothetical protein